MQNINMGPPRKHDRAEKIDEDMEEDNSGGESLHIDFSHYRIYRDQGGFSQATAVSRENERVWK